MPFPNHTRGVTGRFHDLRERDLRFRQRQCIRRRSTIRCRILRHATAERIAPRYQRSTRRRTKRRRTIEMRQFGALRRHLIQMRRFDFRAAIAGEIAVAKVIRQNDDHIRLRRK